MNITEDRLWAQTIVAIFSSAALCDYDKKGILFLIASFLIFICRKEVLKRLIGGK